MTRIFCSVLLSSFVLAAQQPPVSVTYDLSKGALKPAAFPAPKSLAGTTHIRFRLKTDHDTAVAVVLSESQPGGRYTAVVWCPANQPQAVDLLPTDFNLNDGPNDPADPDGKLDLDQVTGLAVVDAAPFFAKLGDNPDFPVTVDRAGGEHTLTVENLTYSQDASAVPKPIDHFDRGFLQWMTPGGMTLKLTGQRLEAAYETRSGEFALLIRSLAAMDLSKTKTIAFDIESEQEETLVLSLELKKSGPGAAPRYNTMIYPPGGRKKFHVAIDFADFDGSPKLDPARLKTLLLADITVAAGGQPTANKLWISNLEVLP